MNHRQQILDLKAKLIIAKQALSKIVRTKGLEGDTTPPHEIARRAIYSIKYYKTFTQSHDVEGD